MCLIHLLSSSSFCWKLLEPQFGINEFKHNMKFEPTYSCWIFPFLHWWRHFYMSLQWILNIAGLKPNSGLPYLRPKLEKPLTKSVYFPICHLWNISNPDPCNNSYPQDFWGILNWISKGYSFQDSGIQTLSYTWVKAKIMQWHNPSEFTSRSNTHCDVVILSSNANTTQGGGPSAACLVCSDIQ